MTQSLKNKIYIISAPSGAGKTSLVKALLEQDEGLDVCISHTTRTMRPGEVAGKHYHFVNKDDFESLIAKQAFIEYARVFDHYYGTSKAAIDSLFSKGSDVILEIDWQGADQAAAIFGQRAVRIFILPPSLKALRHRLTSRAQDSEDVIKRRLSEALLESSHAHKADHIIINDSFDQALADLKAIIRTMRLEKNKDFRLQ
ncbi:MAG: guanylate kinase [Francisellaceae bacterium]